METLHRYSRFMRSNLIPTVIVDKNNKVTTVHKRNGATAPSISKLGSIKPTVGGTNTKRKSAFSKVRYSTNKGGHTSVSLEDLSFLSRAGLRDSANELLNRTGAEGTVEMPDEVLYDYLRLGIEPAEAAILHTLSGGDLEKLKRNKEFAEALPGDLASQRVWGGSEVGDKGIAEVVDYLAGGGVKPSKIAAALRNNLNNENLENNILSPHELTELFSRFTYAIPKNEERGTTVSRTMDALSDGRLPIILADREAGVDRPVITKMLEALYPKTKSERGLMTEDERNNLISADPEMLLDVAKSIQEHSLSRSEIALTHDAIREFGAEACLDYDPRVLASQHADGTVLGVEGAQNALRILEDMQSHISSENAKSSSYGNRKSLSRWSSGTEYKYISGTDSVVVNLQDLSDLNRLGYSAKEIKEMTIDIQMNSHRVVAIKTGDAAPVISEGWL